MAAGLARHRLPVRARITCEPSGEATTARSAAAGRRRRVACAPIGTWQPPPSAASTARSAVTAAWVAAWSSGAQASKRIARGARLDGQRALPDRRAHHLRRQGFRRCGRPSPAASGRRRPAGWRRTGLRRACAGACPDCRAPIRSTRSGRSAPQLRGRGAGNWCRPWRPGGSSSRRLPDHGVARIFALRNRGQHQAVRQFGGQVFQAVHRQVGAAVQQRLLDFLGEQALGARPWPAARR